MIEITSTEREKATIINTLADIKAPCLFPQRDCYDGDNYKCKECLETMIKWNIQGGRQRDRSTKTSPQRNPLEDEDRTRADSDKLAGTSAKECGGAVPA